MKKTRREFLRTAGLVSALTLIGSETALASEGVVANPNAVGMLYDSTLCVGCKACVTSCKRVNDMDAAPAPFDNDRIWDAPSDLDWRTRNIIKLHKEEDGTFAYVKRQCMHCVKPACVSACPVAAMQHDERGIVVYDKNICIGCRYCQVACPFTIPKFEWPEALPKIVKCDLCKHTNLKQKGLPACCETCPTQAVIFGKRTDLLTEAKRRINLHPEKYENAVYGEKEIGGTNVLYLAPANIEFEDLGLPTLPEESFAAASEKVQHTIYKGFIAPVALYGFLALVALKNKNRLKDNHQADKHEEKEGE